MTGDETVSEQVPAEARERHRRLAEQVEEHRFRYYVKTAVISDAEFDKRSWRFWNRAFAGAERVPDDVAAYPAEVYTVTDFLGPHGSNQTAWRRRLINIAGNHDVGYAGDLTVARLERFERAFGKAAYELRFELPLDAAAACA